MTEHPGQDVALTYGLADLVAASGVPARTIRFYQTERLLPLPAKKGRDAVYDAGHLERLVLIGELRDRGMSLSTIRDLLTSDAPAQTVSDWLGIDAALSIPWSEDRPQVLTRGELAELVAAAGATAPGVIGELDTAGYVRAQPDGTWLVDSPALLRHAVRLRTAGIDVDVSAGMRDALRHRLTEAVAEVVAQLVERTGNGFAGSGTVEEIAAAVTALRPVALETTSVIFAHEVERALAALLEAGPHGLGPAHPD